MFGSGCVCSLGGIGQIFMPCVHLAGWFGVLCSSAQGIITRPTGQATSATDACFSLSRKLDAPMAVWSALGSPEASVSGSLLCIHVAVSVQMRRQPALHPVIL